MRNEVISCKCGTEKIFVETQTGLICVCGIGCYNIDCEHSGKLTFGVGFTEKGAKKMALKRWNRRVGNDRV